MADLSKPHDKYFRSSMQNTIIAQQFFNHYLPPKLRQSIDLTRIKLDNSAFLSVRLKESISDLIFTCPYIPVILEIAALLTALANPNHLVH